MNFSGLAFPIRRKTMDKLNTILIQPINIFLKYSNQTLIGTLEDKWKFPFTRHGNPCYSPCHFDGSYGWCGYPNNGWDWEYCSPIDYDTDDALTVHGKKCDNNCARHGGTSYYWCNVGDSWDYCSSFTAEGRYNAPTNRTKVRTINNCDCIDECVPWKDGYQTCSTNLCVGSGIMAGRGYWDYCNTDSNKTYVGEACESDCKFYTVGESHSHYNYCKTNSSWDYCSPSVLHDNDDCKDEPFIDLQDSLLTSYDSVFLSPRWKWWKFFSWKMLSS